MRKDCCHHLFETLNLKNTTGIFLKMGKLHQRTNINTIENRQKITSKKHYLLGKHKGSNDNNIKLQHQLFYFQAAIFTFTHHHLIYLESTFTIEIKRRPHHNFCNLDCPLKTRICWVYDDQHAGFKRFSVYRG